MVPSWADKLLPQLLMEQFDNLPIQWRHIEHMQEGVWFRNFFCRQNDSCENLDNFCLIRLLYIVHGHVYSHGIFFKKANHYNNLNCYTLRNAKPVVGTSKNLAEPDYDVIKMVAILNFKTNLLCFIISIIVGRFKFFRHQNVQNDKCCLLTSKNG